MTSEDLIRQAYDKLAAALPENFTEDDKALVKDAFLLAKEAHKTQSRDSGLPYILHPLAVALITVEEMRQKNAAIVAAALLHDVVEDNKDYTIEDIRNRFGNDVAFLVSAVTKPNKKQADNYKHLLGSVKKDIRVLLLKLSDRLHNMRTLSGLRPQKQWKIASETQFFFAPLAGRLGLFKVKSELENLAFQFLNPQEYERISELLEEERQRTEKAVNHFLKDCRDYVGETMGGSIGWGIRYRKPFSVWREMQERQCDFYHVPFKHFIRVNFDREQVNDGRNDTGTWSISDEDVILRIYSLLTKKYCEQTGSFVNYVAQPKANGYRSVHFRLLNPYGGIEEFHVASDQMRLQSNYGCIMDSKEHWVMLLTDVLQELSEDQDNMMPGISESLYNEDIVTYTPKSKAITLPKGATALDFAYAVHTRIGDHARYARINGRLASIKTKLKRGDCVEIGIDESAHPKQDWLKAVTSYKARKAINDYLDLQPKPAYTLCPHCRPMPGSEIIGFEDSKGKVTIHSRNCPVAIRTASEKGNTIVDVKDFVADPDVFFPVKIDITAIDRFHLLCDIIDCIVGEHRLSMTGLTTKTADDIVSCEIAFDVHSADELKQTVAAIEAIDSVEEVTVKKGLQGGEDLPHPDAVGALDEDGGAAERTLG